MTTFDVDGLPKGESKLIEENIEHGAVGLSLSMLQSDATMILHRQ